MVGTVSNNERFCNTIATIALIDTSIQSDLQLQTKEILLTSKSKQTYPQKLPQNQQGNFLPCASECVLAEKLCACNERGRVNRKFCLADFAYLIQNPSRRHRFSRVQKNAIYSFSSSIQS